MGAKRYSGKEITFIFGTVQVKGYARDQSFIAIEGQADAIELELDVSGEPTFRFLNDNSKRITLRLARPSGDNAALTAIYQTQKQTGEIFIAPLTVKDEFGSDIHNAKEAVLAREPNPEFAAGSAGVAEWVFLTGDMNMGHLGS
ncbi:MAG: DUF3277 family protein [Gammaproteobacteria bacterium]|nr:DUF3277 family protein [Gammaproteobacteria bacterium]NIR85146.1 DUF3277 family protein [Gammaproteobacteria bacterium]NIU06195.1 DUF3277 family protein [Gammaproteobacteria bacterium]NIX87468.1 DUF3277 family protein [Gammaproteobacteria bacterium]